MSQVVLQVRPVERRRDRNAEARVQAAVVEWIRLGLPFRRRLRHSERRPKVQVRGGANEMDRHLERHA